MKNEDSGDGERGLSNETRISQNLRAANSLLARERLRSSFNTSSPCSSKNEALGIKSSTVDDGTGRLPLTEIPLNIESPQSIKRLNFSALYSSTSLFQKLQVLGDSCNAMPPCSSKNEALGIECSTVDDGTGRLPLTEIPMSIESPQSIRRLNLSAQYSSTPLFQKLQVLGDSCNAMPESELVLSSIQTPLEKPNHRGYQCTVISSDSDCGLVSMEGGGDIGVSKLARPEDLKNEDSDKCELSMETRIFQNFRAALLALKILQESLDTSSSCSSKNEALKIKSSIVDDGIRRLPVSEIPMNIEYPQGIKHLNFNAQVSSTYLFPKLQALRDCCNIMPESEIDCGLTSMEGGGDIGVGKSARPEDLVKFFSEMYLSCRNEERNSRGSRRPRSPTPFLRNTRQRVRSKRTKFYTHKQPDLSCISLRRPGYVKIGVQCDILANHFDFTFEGDITRYEVKIVLTEDQGQDVPPKQIQSKALSKRVLEEVKSKHWRNRIIAYNGGFNAYTSDKKLKPLGVFQNVGLQDDWRSMRFDVTIERKELPQDLLGPVSTILGSAPSASNETVAVGRRIFPSKLSDEHPNLFYENYGLQYRLGYCQTVQASTRDIYSLIFDSTIQPFFEEISVVNFISKFLRKPRKEVQKFGILEKKLEEEIKSILEGVIVETTHREGYKASLKVSGFIDFLKAPIMFGEDGRKFVWQYFYDKYGIELSYNSLPLIVYNTKQGAYRGTKYIPMELCTIADSQKFSGNFPSSQKRKDPVDVCCMSPAFKKDSIRRMILENNDISEAYLKEFGININSEFKSVSARILERPEVLYGKGDCGSGMKMYKGAIVKNWAVINFSTVKELPIKNFYKALVQQCLKSGMEFLMQEPLCIKNGDASNIQGSLNTVTRASWKVLKSSKSPPEKLQLLLVILPNKASISNERFGFYGSIKRVCETIFGVVSQCCKPEKISKEDIEKEYFANMAFKINAKLGGINSALGQAVNKQMPFLSDKVTVVFGADVTHDPCIAAVVGSLDWPLVTMYRGWLSGQQPKREIIRDLSGIIRNHLRAFRESTQKKPERIIFFRDGVSKGAFNEVLQKEVSAIYEGCKELEEMPRVTFIVLQKRHRTRLFPKDCSSSKNTNILPGTVVDRDICQPKDFDFFLCSHESIKGTSRPTHYHVLFDENEFTADGLVTLTNGLCHTYARCRQPISIVPPVRYADLLASRARYYFNGYRCVRGEQPKVMLRGVKESIAGSMFFC